MKHLLLALLAAIALPTSVIAGDLGLADFNLDRVIKLSPKRRIKYQETSESDVINILCGGLSTHMKKCVVEFKNGLLVVDGSKGISPNQVKFITLNTFPGIYIEFIYEDSNNKLVSAGLASNDIGEGTGFLTRFLNWMSEGQ